MTQKTAMQEVYDKLNSTNVTIKELFNWLADNETRLLAKEKQDLVDAYDEGIRSTVGIQTSDVKCGEIYYTQKYNQ